MTEPDRSELDAAHCWFPVDRVGDPVMTAFRRRVRLHQARWREREALGKPGSYGRAGSERPNGSLLTDEAAAAGSNFLSDTIRTAVEARLATPQAGQTLEPRRLRRNLLSSMPMCFNLFGELTQDEPRARQTAEFMLPGVASGPVDVVFEWSPGRGDGRFTRDRTAFDVALRVGAEGSPRQIIGIETKYYEHPTRERPPKAERLERHLSQREHYAAIADHHFVSGWRDVVLDTDLEQLWRDHLLLLSMLNDPRAWSAGVYVLVHPAGNVAFAEAASRYAACLIEPSTFKAITLEALLDAHVVHAPATEAKFRDRYLWR